MSKRLQGLIAGVLIGVMLSSSAAFAKNIYETIQAVYMNVKLVVDGEEITPKDVNGNVVEPFIYNGTTYLPVRAIGEAFDKDVQWDGETATVYVGDVVKPAKEVHLYDKPYLECEIPAEFKAGKNANLSDRNITNYIGFDLRNKEEIDSSNYEYHNSVTYALNGLAKKVKGTFIAPEFNNCDSAEYRVNFYNENGTLLYQSPIMTGSVSPIDFEFDPGKALKLRVEFNGHSDWVTRKFDCRIDDFAILTTDY
ncbi:MAG: hypothetical protein IJC88_04140 [Oscillospiraceae bacterium]|nr:hypothetical protein [Oscillospiraceae bacterium]